MTPAKETTWLMSSMETLPPTLSDKRTLQFCLSFAKRWMLERHGIPIYEPVRVVFEEMGEREVDGLYRPGSRLLRIRHGLCSSWGAAAVLHEYIHHCQHEDGSRMTYEAEERQAYRLMYDYLMEMDTPESRAYAESIKERR